MSKFHVFHWDRVSFFCEACVVAMFCIFNENSGDTTWMVELWQSSVHTAQDCSVPHAAPPARYLGMHQKMGGTKPRQVAQAGQRDVPCHLVSCSAVTDGTKEGRGMFGLMPFIFPIKPSLRWTLLSWEWLNICLSRGNSKWIPWFSLFVHVAFALPNKLSLPQPTSFLTFLSQFSLPSHCGGASCCMVLNCLPG